jgi:hypothetical protein
MYEMQGPRPVGRCWLTDCSAARHCLTDHCYQIPVQDAGCPAAQTFRSCPQYRYPSGAPVARLPSRFPKSFPEIASGPGTRPRRRLPGSPAVSGVSPGIGTCYQVPVRDAGCPASRPFPEFPPELAPDSRIPVRNSGCPASRPFSEFPPGAVPVFSGDEFLQPRPDPAQEFSRSNFKIFWSSTGHPKLSPAPSGISTGVSTDSSTDSGISGAWTGSRAQVGPRPETPLSCRRRWATIRRRCHGIRRYRENRRTAAARCRPRSRPPRAPRR